VLVMTGDQDAHLGPSSAVEHVTPKLRHVDHQVIAGSGHLIPLEAPQALAAAILSALTQETSPG
jgi:pimeloyl-ACP methyl ester carboxylesterase